MAIALGLLLVVRGEKRVTITYTVAVRSVAARRSSRPAGPLPVGGHRLGARGPGRGSAPSIAAALGPLRLDLSRAVPGVATWYVKPEALHLPRGVRVDAVHPAQGSVELRRLEP